VDFTLYNGKKCLIIEDSWGPNYGKGGQRIITEDFHNARNWFVAHPMTFKFEETPVPPVVLPKLTKDLQFGMTDAEVKILQDILKTKGLFPINISSNYFGTITLKAVKEYQSKNGLLVDGVVGPVTRSLLNQ
jgi:hypothetical protein